MFHDYVVIGVARNARGSVWDLGQTWLYLPLMTPPAPNRISISARARGDPAAVLRQNAPRAEAAGLGFQVNRRLADELEDEKLPFRGLAALSGALGGLALLMALVGLYGVMAFAVNPARA